MVKLLESLLQLRQPLFNEGLDFLAGGGPAVPEIEQRRNIFEREADGLRGADEAETLERLGTVDPGSSHQSFHPAGEAGCARSNGPSRQAHPPPEPAGRWCSEVP